ncbi:root meristem growth factor 8 [Pyrus ussuriensis x Pyrus communis]|uniref:Root meristem growth factor 8 n=1 Tax=Pyrus ussuriensis x Pyrus communis TaxID=2448454 RepID=A0A5N5H8Y6_9ROSA|nr:root meristem growth factor 8 [Pyrus ussuriensis x Pyrus communis]
MEIPFFTLLCFLILSVLLITPGCASLQTQLQPSNKQGKNELQVSFPTLPRKLRLTGKVTVAEQEGKDSSAYNNHKESALAGGKKPRIEKEEDEEVQVVERSRSAETWQEQMEKEDTSEFFTMDYHRVRRRRPIHNKSFPAVTVSP